MSTAAAITHARIMFMLFQVRISYFWSVLDGLSEQGRFPIPAMMLKLLLFPLCFLGGFSDGDNDRVGLLWRRAEGRPTSQSKTVEAMVDLRATH